MFLLENSPSITRSMDLDLPRLSEGAVLNTRVALSPHREHIPIPLSKSPHAAQLNSFLITTVMFWKPSHARASIDRVSDPRVYTLHRFSDTRSIDALA